MENSFEQDYDLVYNFVKIENCRAKCPNCPILDIGFNNCNDILKNKFYIKKAAKMIREWKK